MAEGYWGYRCLIVRDPDGNELWFNHPDPADPPPPAPMPAGDRAEP